jgi:DNA primase
LAAEVAHKLAVDSSVLRQELRHLAVARTARPVTPPPEPFLTEAERVLVRALASPASELDLIRHVEQHLRNRAVHLGLPSESLIRSLAENIGVDVMQVPLSEPDRALLARCLLDEDEDLTQEAVNSAYKALERKWLQGELERIQRAVLEAERRKQSSSTDEERQAQHRELAQLAMQKSKLKQELDPIQLAGR